MSARIIGLVGNRQKPEVSTNLILRNPAGNYLPCPVSVVCSNHSMAGEEQGGIPADMYGPLLNNLTQAVFLKDQQGRVVYVNQTYCELLGRKPEEVIGRTDQELFSPDLANKYRMDDQHVLETNQPLELIEENPAPDGSVRYVQVIKMPLLRDGKPFGVQGMFWEVTDEMRTRAKSRENQERFERVARATNDTVWDWDLVERRHHHRMGLSTGGVEAFARVVGRTSARGRPGRNLEVLGQSVGRQRRTLVGRIPFSGIRR